MLPPVGDAVQFGPSHDPPVITGHQCCWLDSGTSALALALTILKHIDPTRREVIIPAYTCPDLVAAARYADLLPVVVDIGRGDPGYDLDSLAIAINEQTLAVVAVNFMGIRDRLNAIKSLLPSPCFLIEDCAQWLPEPFATPTLYSDMAIASFGRGKPASLLGGGLLLIGKHLGNEKLTLAERVIREQVQEAAESAVKFRFKAWAYNRLRQPFFYNLINVLPFLHLGETHYHPLAQIAAMAALRLAHVYDAVTDYQLKSRDAQKAIEQMVAEIQSLTALPVKFSDRCGRLLRYPILCDDQASRNNLLQALQQKGLGASSLYKDALVTIPGVQKDVRLANSYTNASDFASRLLTLPVHSGVTVKHLQQMHRVLSQFE